MENKPTPQGSHGSEENTNHSQVRDQLTKSQKALLIFFLSAEACCLVYFCLHTESMHAEVKVMLSITCILRNVGLYYVYQLPTAVSKIEKHFAVIFILLFFTHFVFFHDWKYGFYICDTTCIVIIADFVITFVFTRILCLIFNMIASRNS
ncbi:MAG TPA: hypothetical protein PLN38_03065 [Chitinophagales bacterium]|nr:hypothetical protein [Chitinophagales bacterium]